MRWRAAGDSRAISNVSALCSGHERESSTIVSRLEIKLCLADTLSFFLDPQTREVESRMNVLISEAQISGQSTVPQQQTLVEACVSIL